MSGEKRRHDSDEDQSGRSGQTGESSRPSKQSRTVENEMERIGMPVSIDLETFVSSRKDELVNLANIVKVKMRKLVSQQLPRHLRRRTVSHNKKRLPKRLQPRFNAEGAKETKRPSRLHRRRPRNLQEEYEKRSNENRWLETHIWHAKRFRMLNCFGYRLPESSFDKSLRACYRGAAKYCLLNDISYQCCIQLSGAERGICAILDRHTSNDTGLRVGARKFIEGVFEGTTCLYEAGAYPYGAIGEVTFMWRPRFEHSNDRVLWVWCHPEIRELLLDAFRLPPESAEDSETPSSTPEDTGVRVEDLRDELNRFRLTGPLSVRTLCETLTQDTSGLDVGLKLVPEYYNHFWEALRKNSLSASSFIRDSQIAGNVVLDPRLHMPTKRLVPSVMGAAEDQTSSKCPLSRLGEIPVNTELWDAEMRDRVKQQMLTQDAINKLRQKNLVPGTPLELKEKESRIPIMVVFRSGSQEHLGYGRGCDVIVPSGWGRQFFIALNYRGARASGLRDLNAVTRHSDRFVFPDDVPDSVVAQRHLRSETERLREKHFTYPPNKRPGFHRLGVFHPYAMPFDMLVESYIESNRSEEGEAAAEAAAATAAAEAATAAAEAATETATAEAPVRARTAIAAKRARPYVVRNRTVLEALAYATRTGKFESGVLESYLEGHDVESALVPVKLVAAGKGVPQRFARICVIPESLEDCFVLPAERSHPKRMAERECYKECYAYTPLIAAIENQFPIVGFVVSGDRNLTGKTATGLGYVSLNGLLETSASFPNGASIAFRNQDVFNYFRVQMHVIV